MPRRLIPFVPNEYYHIYNRGNNRERICFEETNYLYFLRGLKKYVQPVTTIIAYCLMPNHYHLVVRMKDTEHTSKVPSPLTPFSRAMKNFLISYTKGINERYSRVGTLFQGMFKAKPIETYSYLINLCVYVHANPVKDGLVQDIKDWPYSNYLEWIGERPGSLADNEFIKDNFDSPDEYKALVMEYLKTRNLPDDIRSYLNTLDE
ncbi:MAG: transposase [Anaerolineales bacterium]|uniref:transposase n=1 Tax=Candidatus Villigracilis proximus TaxID=3140683 RepID=UPI003135C45B|nr:transposase [Anaerolineales bacterium]